MGRYAAQKVKEENGLFMTAFPIRKETIGGLLKIGWEVIGDLPVLVYPLRFRNVVNRYLHCSPLSLLIGGAASGGYRLLRGRREKEEPEGIPVEAVTELDGSFDRFWEKAVNLYPVMGVRDRTYLTWRYFTHPVRTYTLFRTVKNGEMVGYIVLRKVDLLGFNSAVIVDFLALDDHALRALVERGIEWSRGAGADLLGCMVPKWHPYHRILKDAGFFPSGKTFSYMIYRIMKERVPLDRESWYVNWGDTDVI
jgi:hypothetical protein